MRWLTIIILTTLSFNLLTPLGETLLVPQPVQAAQTETEVTSKRTASSKTFDLGNGKFKVESSLGTVHYKDDSGNWQDIDTNIENSSDDTNFNHQNNKNSFKTHFKNKAKNNNLVKFDIGGRNIRFSLEDNADLGNVNNNDSVISGNTVTYPNVYDGVDLKYTISPTSLLEEFIVSASESAKKINSLTEQFSLSGVKYEEQPDGSIDFLDEKTNELVFTIPKPVMYELNQRIDPATEGLSRFEHYGLHYTISQQGNKYYLTKVLDAEGKTWLADPARVYPVVIDASVGPNSPGTMADDATVGTVAWTNPTNAGASDDVYATWLASTFAYPGYYIFSHYLKATNFGFSIPSGATIDGILVEVEKRSTRPTTYDTNVQIVKSDGSIGTTNKAITGTVWGTTDAYYSYGASNDLWGETWDDTKINDVDFGVVIANKGFSQGDPSLNENTLISTANGYVKIKDIKVGDKVVSYNEKIKKTELKTVEVVISHPISDAHSRYFYIYSNGQIVKATENHRFFVGGSYIRADELRAGDKLLGLDLKEHPIERIEVVENTTDMVWDLTVEDNHNFFANDILVHNGTATTSRIDHIRITVYYTESSNATPTNDSLTFTNPNTGGSNDAVADDTTEWNFRAVASDADGYANLGTVVLSLANSTDSTTPFDSLKFTWTEATDAFAETADTQNAATITSTGTDSSCATNTCTLDFKIRFNSSFATQATNYNAELLTTDDAAATDTDTYTSFYQVTAAPPTISISSPADISLGTITGTGTSSTGEATWTVITNNSAGYKLEWQASAATMSNANADTIAAYTPAVADTPETWSVATADSEWGGRLKSTSTDYVSGTWGSDDTTNAKWLNVKSTAVFQIASRASSTAGSDEIVQFKAQIGTAKFQPTGAYTVNVTLTATTL